MGACGTKLEEKTGQTLGTIGAISFGNSYFDTAKTTVFCN
jgi:hypothetical protein